MRRFLLAYGAALVVLVGMDMVWLTLSGPTLYRPRMGDMLLEQPVLAAAAAFYLLYAAGVVVLAAAPGFAAGAWTRATLLGALLGVVAYGTYDLTNHATLRNWSSLITVVDMAWGAVLTAVAATAAYLAGSWRG
jgi:uncharacterized membrane protein